MSPLQIAAIVSAILNLFLLAIALVFEKAYRRVHTRNCMLSRLAYHMIPAIYSSPMGLFEKGKYLIGLLYGLSGQDPCVRAHIKKHESKHMLPMDCLTEEEMYKALETYELIRPQDFNVGPCNYGLASSTTDKNKAN